MDPTPLWTPNGRDIGRANLTRFIWAVDNEYGPGLAGCAALYHWSITRPQEFWPAVWEFCEVRASATWEKVWTEPRPMSSCGWFPGARLNFAENLLRQGDARTALVARAGGGERALLGFAELRERVLGLAGGLRDLGIEPAERVAGWLPNRPELVVATLASSALGAIWATLPRHLDPGTCARRLAAFGPAVLFAERWDGELRELLAQVPSIRHLVLLEPAATPADVPQPLLVHGYAALETTATVPTGFAQLPFDHPLFVTFALRADGTADPVLHSAGGTLLGHLKELSLHTDVHSEDRLLYLTDPGSTLWYWTLTALALGASLVLYDGPGSGPGLPELRGLLAEEAVSIFGCNEAYVESLEASAAALLGPSPARLRTVLCDGMQLPAEAFDRVYALIKPDVRLSAMATSEDLMGCLALGNPDIPVFRGEFQCRGLGIDVQTVDPAGQPVRGEPGTLVCTQPFPSLPLGLWNDPDGIRYRRAYLERVPGAWSTGHRAELTGNEGLVLDARPRASEASQRFGDPRGPA